MPRCDRAPARWQVWVDPVGRSGPENMAIDQALLETADRTGAAFLRLYRWDPPCLSFGRHEAALRRYDRAAIERLGVATVRRPTGGRAVWHEQEATYAVAAPVAAFGSLRAAYRVIHERLARALRSLGIRAALAPPAARASVGEDPCFAAPVGGEVVAHGRKLVGSAQLGRGAAFLQHGSILLDGSQEVVSTVSRQPSAHSRSTTVAAILGRPVSFDDVSRAITAEWGESLTPTVPDRLRPSSTAPFSDPLWTWRR